MSLPKDATPITPVQLVRGGVSRHVRTHSIGTPTKQRSCQLAWESKKDKVNSTAKHNVRVEKAIPGRCF